MQVLLKLVLINIFLSGAFLHFSPLLSQGFEGEITFAKESNEDTTFYIYKIKGDKVRVDELNKKYQLINYMIVNLTNQTIFAINPNRKLYTDLPVHLWKPDRDTSNFRIIKSDNYQNIKGYKCYQWRVQNKKEDTEITYWVAKEQFNFFNDFLKIVNRSEKSSAYFLQIPDTRGFFSMMCVERSMLRENRMQLLVTEISRKSLPLSVFEIPADYKMFQKN